MRRRRGEVSPIGLIATIIIVVLIMVFVIWGVSGGFRDFRANSGSFAPSNVQVHITACTSACSLYQDRYDFCSNPRTVNFGQNMGLPSGQQDDTVTMTCRDLAINFANLGFKPCPNLC